MSHVVVAIFIGVAAVAAVADAPPAAHVAARGRRSAPSACALTAVWSLPLLGAAGVHAEHAVREARSRRAAVRALPSWMLRCPNPVKHTIDGIVRGARRLDRRRDGQGDRSHAVAAVVDLAARRRRDRRRRLVPPPLDARAARCSRSCSASCSSSGPSTRSGTRGSCRSGCSRGASSPRWARPSSLRLVATGRAWAYTLDHATATCKTRAPARGPTLALDDDADDRPRGAQRRGRGCSPSATSTRGPPGWEPPAAPRSPSVLARRARRIVGRSRSPCSSAIAGIFGAATARGARATATRASRSRAGRSGTTRATRARPRGPSTRTLIEDDGHARRPGRALWEPSSATRSRSTATARRLALELLPYFTKGRIGSMEGLYFESSATTSFHFLTVSELASIRRTRCAASCTARSTTTSTSA